MNPVSAPVIGHVLFLPGLQGNIRVHCRIRPATSAFLMGVGMTDLIQCNSEGEMWLKAEGLVGDHRREAGGWGSVEVFFPGARILHDNMTAGSWVGNGRLWRS